MTCVYTFFQTFTGSHDVLLQRSTGVKNLLLGAKIGNIIIQLCSAIVGHMKFFEVFVGYQSGKIFSHELFPLRSQYLVDSELCNLIKRFAFQLWLTCLYFKSHFNGCLDLACLTFKSTTERRRKI